MAIQVRKYDENDLTGLMAVWEHANELAHPFLNEKFVAQVRREIPELYLPNSDTWVAIDSSGENGHEELVGFLSLIGNEVGAIFVSPDSHACGIGTQLMDKAQSLFDELEVEVFKENIIGRNFYKKYGFTFLEEKHHEASGHLIYRLVYRNAR